MRLLRTRSLGAGALPNLLLIGAAKSGTTSLHRYLDHHPSIHMSRPKELKFFNRDDWETSLDWYRAHFPATASVRGESSPLYSMHPWFPDIPERISRVVPDARIVYLVRDPVERLVAQYVELFAVRLEHRPLDEALSDYESPSNRVVLSSRYAYQIDRYRQSFPDAQILVLDQRDLLAARAETLRRVFDFVGVDRHFTSRAFDELHNVRARKLRLNRAGVWLQDRGTLKRIREPTRVLPPELRERLKLLIADPVSTPPLDPGLRSELEHHLRDDANRFRALTGQPFAHWSV